MTDTSVAQRARSYAEALRSAGHPRVRTAVATVTALAGLALGSAVTAAQVLDRAEWPYLLDFRIYVGASGAFAHGDSIYAYQHPELGLGSTYPPAASLLFLLFTLLEIRAAEWVWTAINLGLMFGAGVMICRQHLRLPWRETWLWASVGFGIACMMRPQYVTLGFGQINIVLWFLILFDLFTVSRGRPWGGVASGIATAIKLVPGVFVAVFLISRRFGAVARAIAAFVACAGIAWLIVPSDSQLFWTKLLWDSSRVGPLGDEQNNSIRFVLAHIPLDERARLILWGALVILIAGFGLFRASRLFNRGSVLLAGIVTGCVGALCSPITWTHHLVFLPLIVLFLPRTRWVLINAAMVAGSLWFFWDPIGLGYNLLTGVLRAAVMVLVVFGVIGTDRVDRMLFRPRPEGLDGLDGRAVRMSPMAVGAGSTTHAPAAGTHGCEKGRPGAVVDRVRRRSRLSGPLVRD